MKPYAKLNKIFVRALGGDKRRGIMQAGHWRIPCALGQSGISAFKREGDKATPLARMRIISGFRKGDARILPRCAVPLARMRNDNGWCDDPRDRNYNRPVRLPYKAGAECLRRDDNLYNIGFILDWNSRPRIRGRGSAIFFHLARPYADNADKRAVKRQKPRAAALFKPTAGCIAIDERAMRRLIPHLRRRTELIVLG